MQTFTTEIKLSPRKINSILKDAAKSAEAVHLVYVSDAEKGITRIRKGNQFSYLFRNKKITNRSILERIRKLVIPPAWENVWICVNEAGHLQATGTDIKQRKQYRYHPLWNSLRNQTKFYRLQEFGTLLPAIRKQVESDLAKKGMPVEKVLALVVSLMEYTHIRVGNNLYEKLYGSFGLTTLKDKHVKFSGDTVRFFFRGKKGVQHTISVHNKRFAKLVKTCRDIPGKELFQYYDSAGKHRCIDSGMVNNYIKQISGSDFSAKDFRTWSGTMHALLAFKSLGEGTTATDTKRKIVAALDEVAEKLGNTRTVCKKYYVHPLIISLFEEKKISSYFSAAIRCTDGLSEEESILMKIMANETNYINI